MANSLETILGHGIEYGLDFRYVSNYLAEGRNITRALSQAHQLWTNAEHVRLIPASRLPADSSNSSGSQRDLSSSTALESGQLLFISGRPSAADAALLTTALNISPEFWRRHIGPLELATEDAFENLKLPSIARDVFQIKIWTLGSRGSDTSNLSNDLKPLRRRGEELMKRYHQSVKSGMSSWRSGDSIVRRYEVHDEEYFSIEQLVSIHLAKQTEGSFGKKLGDWFAIVCSDCGRDLSDSPNGPWRGDHYSYTKYYTHFLPVRDHRSWLASHKAPPVPPRGAAQQQNTLTKLPQSFSKLPDRMEALQDHQIMRRDPLYCLTGVLSFYISSEAEVLGFFGSQIASNSIPVLGTSTGPNTHSLSNLLHYRGLLSVHVDQLQDVSSFLKLPELKCWPQSGSDAAEKAISSLGEDLKYLLLRGEELQKQTETLIGLAMNVATIEEARRGAEQNRALFRFTIFASVYVPLSFTATLFGMNFKQFGQGDLSIWIYVAVSAPVFALSAFLLFDGPRKSLMLAKAAAESFGWR